jgi:hypothetical protein
MVPNCVRVSEQQPAAQPPVDPNSYQVPSAQFLKTQYQHPANVIRGAVADQTTPEFIGGWQHGSTFDNLVMALTGANYQAAKADPDWRPARYTSDWEYVRTLLSTPQGRDYAVDNWIGLSDVKDTSPEAEFQRAQHQQASQALDQRRFKNTNVATPSYASEMTTKELEENLRDWFKQKWVRFGPDGKIRGSCARGSKSEGKPKCLPQAKAHALGKKGRASAASRKRRQDPNPERSGAAINVATKKS